ncbi:MAG TPA: SIS domain-containing protein [Verrucomicrobiae bacterium]|nr:SIS domain-containing protein [Verrucomicrobiae bacterium]
MATVSEQLDEAARVFAASAALAPAIERAAAIAVETLRAGGTLFACGNGGSCADAMHLVEECVGRYRSNRRPLPAICLSADAPSLTCIANDFGYDDVFARPLRALARRGDALFAFSTSGNSPSVLRALEAAGGIGVRAILLGGGDGGAARSLAEIPILVPSRNSARIQEVHGFILHAVLEAVEAAFLA